MLLKELLINIEHVTDDSTEERAFTRPYITYDAYELSMLDLNINIFECDYWLDGSLRSFLCLLYQGLLLFFWAAISLIRNRLHRILLIWVLPIKAPEEVSFSDLDRRVQTRLPVTLIHHTCVNLIAEHKVLESLHTDEELYELPDEVREVAHRLSQNVETGHHRIGHA
jgi:hypothetical protein